MKAFLSAWAGKYDDYKYPKEFYFDSLAKIRQADSPEELSEGIIGMLHWKDGKVRRGDGLCCLNGKQYILSTTKPNTYFSDKHDKIFGSYEFFTWVKTGVVDKGFNIQHLKKITTDGFHLWEDNSLVIPIFLLHILAPGIYPIYDQHVERAKRVLTGSWVPDDDSDIIPHTIKIVEMCGDKGVFEYVKTKFPNLKVELKEYLQ